MRTNVENKTKKCIKKAENLEIQKKEIDSFNDD